MIRTRAPGAQGRKQVTKDDLWLFAADASVVRLERVFRLFAFDPAHVAAVSFDRGDPLAALIRRQHLSDGDRSLADALGAAPDQGMGAPTAANPEARKESVPQAVPQAAPKAAPVERR